MNNTVIVHFVLILMCLCTSGLSNAQVLVHPSSKLVPPGTEVTFQCKIIANRVQPHWIINQYQALLPDHLAYLHSQGYHISSRVDCTATILTLRVIGTIDKNGTEVYCTSSQRSNTAFLLIIEESPVVPNPSVTNINPTTLLLKWSPPFLWSGYSIIYYNISITNSSGYSIHYRVNATFSDRAVSFSVAAHQSQIQSCDELRFSIVPISNDQVELKPITATGGYIPSTAIVPPYDINVSVLFKPDRTPVVVVEIEISQFVCTYQIINYTIIIESKDQQNRSHLGPYEQLGHNAILKTISSVADFREDSEYTVAAVINTFTGSILSHTFTFNTSIQHRINFNNNATMPNIHGIQTATDTSIEHRIDFNNNATMSNIQTATEDPTCEGASLYKAVMISFICMTILCMLLLLFMLVGFSLHCRKSSKQVNTAASRACNAMVHNPIYDGPVYESIPQPQFDSPTTALSYHSSISPKNSLRLTTSSDPQSLTSHYVEQPSQIRSNPNLISTSEQCKSHFKSNGVQGNEMDILHLTPPVDKLPCDPAMENVNSSSTPQQQSQSGSAMPEMLSDAYTVMSPAGTITSSLKE